MGIMDKFVRKPFKKSVKKEMDKIIKSKKYTADELTKEKIKEIRREAAENVLKRNVKIAAGVGITCSAIGAAYVFGGSKETENPLKDKLSGQVTSIEDTVSIIENQPEIKSELDILIDEIDAMESSEDAKSFFKKMYVEQYNKDHDTNLYEENIEFTSRNQSHMYDIGDKLVSHGAYPQGVTDKLKSDNIPYEWAENLDLYKVELVKNGEREILESTTIQNSEVKEVVIGEDYMEGKTSLESSGKVTLCDLTDVMDDVINLCTYYNIGNDNEHQEIIARKKILRESVTKYKEAKTIEQIEENIQKGVR